MDWPGLKVSKQAQVRDNDDDDAAGNGNDHDEFKTSPSLQIVEKQPDLMAALNFKSCPGEEGEGVARLQLLLLFNFPPLFTSRASAPKLYTWCCIGFLTGNFQYCETNLVDCLKYVTLLARDHLKHDFVDFCENFGDFCVILWMGVWWMRLVCCDN